MEKSDRTIRVCSLAGGGILFFSPAWTGRSHPPYDGEIHGIQSNFKKGLMKNNKTVKQIFLLGMALILLMGIILVWFWQSLPPQVPWFYSLPSGEQQLVSKFVLAAVLGGSVGILFITRMIAKWSSVEDAPVEIALMTGGLVVVILMAAGFFRVVQIIIGL